MVSSSSRYPLPDAARSHLRQLVSVIEGELGHWREQAATPDGPTDALLDAWAELIGVLALGAEPRLRECPVCHHVGMRAATLCGYCWTTLVPPIDVDSGEASDREIAAWEGEGGTG